MPEQAMKYIHILYIHCNIHNKYTFIYYLYTSFYKHKTHTLKNTNTMTIPKNLYYKGVLTPCPKLTIILL